MTRSETGVGTLGCAWTADFFDWGCPIEDEDCAEQERVRDAAAEVSCDFELGSNGVIGAECSSTPTPTRKKWDCEDTYVVDGTVYEGRIEIMLNYRQVGADYDGEDDVVLITAVAASGCSLHNPCS